MTRPLACLALLLVLMFHVGAALFLLVNSRYSSAWWVITVAMVVAAVGAWTVLTDRDPATR